ncbi:Piso0_005570 [Millerozyma farinosa CBS 7064]|uniref:Piso0_005570 protein n=1 Tax=Pichia sorbitophila (strain ATCC MYA-4447 / BCRC 22081 / CBS 7064 / NBRC 10061 / NRRL Y-12695) TaxID=559304 RepID=G8XZC6_PICSO|nr:Piso0_005570 [Millerozyma farinosa CBS 7064]
MNGDEGTNSSSNDAAGLKSQRGHAAVALERHVYQKPFMGSHPNTQLKINVPDGNNSDDDDMSPPDSDNQKGSLGSPVSVPVKKRHNKYEITQLPTPVVNAGDGPFSRFEAFPPKGPSIEISKTRNAPPTFGSNRIVSDFIHPANRGNGDKTSNDPYVNKRHTSYPLVTADVAESLSDEDATQGSKDDSIDAENLLLESLNLGKVFMGRREIGKGNFSRVILASNVDDETEFVAVKIIMIPVQNANEICNFKSFIKRELNILHNLQHPSIIHLLDYSINISYRKSEIEDDVYYGSEDDGDTDHPDFTKDLEVLKKNNKQLIFMNYCKGGDLLQFSLENHKAHFLETYYWRIIERIAAELVVAVSYLHSKNIVHRDIKLENVLLNLGLQGFRDEIESKHDVIDIETPFINLGDFGLSKKLSSADELLATRCGSQDYIAPELLMGLKYDGRKTDSWSIGVLIYALLEDRLPFDMPSHMAQPPAGISPSVLRRKRARHNPAHRISMIDWDWYRLIDLISNPDISDDSKRIIKNLKNTVDVFLVRKDRRLTTLELINSKEFAWIRDCVPPKFFKHLS